MGNNYNKEDNVEFSRLNEELIVRLNNCYGDGATLSSFFLLYFATSIVGLIQCVNFSNQNISFLIFGFISLTLYFFPIIILLAFSEKYKENLIGLINISMYISIYHEKINIDDLNQKVRGKKWEMLHKNTRRFSHKYESKEYFYLALTSFAFLVISFIISIFNYLYINEKDIVATISFGIIITLFILLVVFSILILIKIYDSTDIKRFEKIGELLSIFYESEHDFLLNNKDSKKLILELKEKEAKIDMCIDEDKYPFKKLKEVINNVFRN